MGEMKLRDDKEVSGELSVRIYRRGRLEKECTEKNLVVLKGRNKLAKLISGQSQAKIEKIGLGTGIDAARDEDTNLSGEVQIPLRSEFGSDYATVSGTDAIFSFDIYPNECNGMRITEFALYDSDNEMFSHRVRSGAITKDEDIEIAGEWTIHF